MAVGAYNFTNPMARFREAEAQGDQWRRDRARITAGRRVANGDFDGGSQILYRDGALDEGSSVQTYGRKLADDQGARRAATALANRQFEGAAKEYGALGDAQGVAGAQNAQVETLKRQQGYLREAAPALVSIYQKAGPAGVSKAFDFVANDMKKLGATDDEIEPIRQGLASDPETTLSLIQKQAAKEYEFRSSGDEVLVLDKATGQLVSRYRGGRAMSLGEGGSIVDVPGEYGSGPASAHGAPQGGSAAPTATPGPSGIPEPLIDAWIRQESGNRPGVLGPMTKYGQAKGLTQVLDSTGQGVAQKLGIPWRADLMTGASPEAAAYQKQIGLAYLKEGVEKYGGDLRKGLMYYHGGPDEAQWGRKTRGYAEAILRNSGTLRPADQPYEVASAGATPGPPMQGGARTIASRPKPQASRMGPDQLRQWGLPEDGIYAMGTDGKPTRVSEGPSEKALTDGERNSASLFTAALAGNERLNGLAKAGIFKPQTATDTLFQTDKNGVLRLVARTETDRRFVQAAKEFLAPILRKDTGAAVTDTELQFYMDTYIPRFEDSPAVLKQKAEARDTALGRVYMTGKRAYRESFGSDPKQWQVLTDPRAYPGRKPDVGAGSKGQPKSTGRTVIDINGRVLK